MAIEAVASFTAYKVHMFKMKHIGEGQIFDGMGELDDGDVNRLSIYALNEITVCMANQKKSIR